jgi:membrane fusion protein (multidrug efflux system)|nr:MAG: efflux transporter periplasmic adaptor subunit [Pseudomonadota bacterium]
MTKTFPVLPALSLALLLAACGGNAPPPAAGAAPEVGVITLSTRAVELTTELPGRTSAFRIAEVRPQVEGIIKKRLFTEGSQVVAGQPLYQIDDATYRAAVLRAEASLASAEAQLNAARLLTERYGPLHERGVVSKQDYDNAVAASTSAEAAVAAAKAALEAARIDLSYTQVRSPISGRIGRSLVTEGALVTRNQEQPLATVAQLDPIYVDVTQSSAELLRLQRDFAEGRLQRDANQNARVLLTLEDGAAYPHAGSLKFAEVTVESSTGSVLLRAQFPNPDGVLLPGMFVRARLSRGSASEALLVPQAAVQRNGRGEPVVLVVGEEDKVSERVIQLGPTVGSEWLVTGGLAAGERIIVEGLQKARAGITVTPAPVGNAGGN